MTDLSAKIEDVSNERIAQYLGVSVEVVHVARQNGAKTFNDVYNFSKGVHEIIVDDKSPATGNKNLIKKPLPTNTPWGKKYFK